jgi:hypothetical protein
MTLRRVLIRWALFLLCASVASGAFTSAATPSGRRISAAIRSLTVTGSTARPVFTVSGTGLTIPPPSPKTSPSGQPLCPLKISGNSGLDYGTRFYVIVWDGQPADSNAQLYAAGRYRPELNELDCIGIVVLKHSPTRVTFTFGHGYLQYYRGKPGLIRAGDVVDVVVNGASFATVIRFH